MCTYIHKTEANPTVCLQKSAQIGYIVKCRIWKWETTRRNRGILRWPKILHSRHCLSHSVFFFRETPKAQETKAKVIGFHQTKSSLFIWKNDQFIWEVVSRIRRNICQHSSDKQLILRMCSKTSIPKSKWANGGWGCISTVKYVTSICKSLPGFNLQHQQGRWLPEWIFSKEIMKRGNKSSNCSTS